MPLSSASKKQFRTIGHSLTPVVTVAGNGLSEGVIDELVRALDDHELIKVRLVIGDRDERKLTIKDMCSRVGAEVVQEIGKVALIYKPSKEPDPKLSNLLR